ncbi:ArsA-related P-loop ATPase [Halorubrum sp. CSM-61]|uniref:ATP-binding protein n=1 Tax=Halorubrum sp. CSM-61 TaxID=2485838 RepID=UPI000F4B416F|nr:ArsA-related P-loop ATPase [Halorubrum sp. CSM-61]
MCDACGRHGDGNSHDGSNGSHGQDHREDHEHTHGHDHRKDHDGRVTEPDATVDTDGTVRIAITGKGGVGKSTVAAAVAQRLANGHETTAIDADPDMNLATSLGVEEPSPVTDERDLIEDRAGTGGGLIRLTPDVKDVLETHSAEFGPEGRLLTIGAPAAGNTGCMCPENSFVRSLVSSALAEEYVVMDMPAGIEHLGRGTAEAVDAFVVVVEPSRTSIDTAERITELAADLGVDTVRAVVNKTRGNAETVADKLDVPVIATLPYDEEIAAAGLGGDSPVRASARLRDAATEVVGAFRTTSGDHDEAEGGAKPAN